MSNRTLNRRGFLSTPIGALGAVTLDAGLQAQRIETGVRSSGRYDDSMIFERRPFTGPGGKTLAVWVMPHVEVWDFDSTVEAALLPGGGPPGLDVINYASRDYGIRVGLSRIMELLDRAGIRGTAALSAAACDLYPKQVAEMTRLKWEFMGHGITNSRLLSGLSIEQEREVIAVSVRTVEAATGTKAEAGSVPVKSKQSTPRICLPPRVSRTRATGVTTISPTA